MFDGTVFNGSIISRVRVGEKGVSMKVICEELNDVFRLYIPSDQVKGENLLKSGDRVKLHYLDLYPSGNEIRMNVENVLKANGTGK